MSLYQKRMEKKRLERELEELEVEKKKCSRKLEYAQEILRSNRKRMEDIANFELEKAAVLRRFGNLSICQRSVESMRYVLGRTVSGQRVQSLYDQVEEKTEGLKRTENSLEEELEELQRRIRYIRERIAQTEQEIRIEIKEQEHGRNRY